MNVFRMDDLITVVNLILPLNFATCSVEKDQCVCETSVRDDSNADANMGTINQIHTSIVSPLKDFKHL